ncbi:RAD protein (Pv-fam-e) [Plasmodium vivax India VII]|uniref:Plasmodium RESA N-terminal domain-containing protein n=3 Tax=Plasmodium vivax TaxID=5855 RepID=A0A1G4GSK9_PLAVI|nr:RAD protein (Pv-fam-e) [Plasmodium vivax India VII]KMZ94693.1 RAD protein (Pv-fam-e) [Plasmodium vivax Mauritania I]CAI7718415.1 Plasmodium exported protein (PHISTc), unknown function [Plasmodium vivax]SCO65559.1 Plasmodium exported protein (PHISTc), unknown function [Plasmodium vivax]VUZ93706.1 Plasmodium exported protein (PHISTc), unknown function [Plasmodium vivax]
MSYKNARLENVVRPRTFKGPLLCLSCLFFLAHPFIVAPVNLLPGVEPNRHYDLRILAEASPSNGGAQPGGSSSQDSSTQDSNANESTSHESNAQVRRAQPRNPPGQAQPTQGALPKDPQNLFHGIPRNRLGNYKTSSPNLRNEKNKQNKKKKKSQKRDDPNNEKHIPEQSIKLTEEEVLARLNNLNGIVSKKDMYILWFNLHNLYVRKYYAMMKEVWMKAESSASRRNIPQQTLEELWWRVYASLINELREKDKSCVNDFYSLLDKGECTSDVYISFLEGRRKVWTDAINMMRYKW